MSHTSNYIAIDLGAESGRTMLARFDGRRIDLTPVHRFANTPVWVLGGLYWNVLALFGEIKQGLGIAGRELMGDIDGIGVDTWGVDYALLGKDDALLGNPRNYRDPRTDGVMEKVFARVPRTEIFEQTGIQFMQLNTLFQMYASRLAGDAVLDQARTLLMLPDLLNYWLTGTKTCEFSDATTTQFYDPRQRDWARSLLDRLGLPSHILLDVIQPGTLLGPLHPNVSGETGLASVPVIAPACHDTGSAVAAVPFEREDSAYLSSGTWSLIGVETREPVINAQSLAFNVTNEGGVCGTYRLLKNIMGLWIVQQCRHTWAQSGQELSYAEIAQQAAQAPAFGPLIDVDAHDFLHPGDMPVRIQAFCARTGQRVPEGVGEIARCAFESLACTYRWVLERMEILAGRPLNQINIVGGGSQNELLSQFTADCTRRPVVAGPIEATALGNVLMQLMATGRISSLAEGRQIVRQSFDLITYEPSASSGWEDAYARYCALHEQTPLG
ncbi:MAG: rhamnulokinase [Chloroflexi bacterium]|nr:rhamnulokinase [Chloroflexota bacterium]